MHQFPGRERLFFPETRGNAVAPFIKHGRVRVHHHSLYTKEGVMLKKIGSLLCAGILMCGMVSAASAELKVGMVFDVGGKGD